MSAWILCCLVKFCSILGALRILFTNVTDEADIRTGSVCVDLEDSWSWYATVSTELDELELDVYSSTVLTE